MEKILVSFSDIENKFQEIVIEKEKEVKSLKIDLDKKLKIIKSLKMIKQSDFDKIIEIRDFAKQFALFLKNEANVEIYFDIIQDFMNNDVFNFTFYLKVSGFHKEAKINRNNIYNFDKHSIKIDILNIYRGFLESIAIKIRDFCDKELRISIIKKLVKYLNKNGKNIKITQFENDEIYILDKDSLEGCLLFNSNFMYFSQFFIKRMFMKDDNFIKFPSFKLFDN